MTPLNATHAWPLRVDRVDGPSAIVNPRGRSCTISVAVSPRWASQSRKRDHQCASTNKGMVSIGSSKIDPTHALMQLPINGPYVVWSTGLTWILSLPRERVLLPERRARLEILTVRVARLLGR